jgi:hypothetical protein
VNSIFLLRALAAQKMPLAHRFGSCLAVEKPVIHAGLSEIPGTHRLRTQFEVEWVERHLVKVICK